MEKQREWRGDPKTDTEMERKGKRELTVSNSDVAPTCIKVFQFNLMLEFFISGANMDIFNIFCALVIHP